jgi:hypothetical protein
VKWLRTIAVLVLAVLWTPVSVHCQLEQLPGLEFLSCCSHEDIVPHEDDDCEGDACAVVESGFYKTEERQASLPAPEFEVLEFAAPPTNLVLTSTDADGPLCSTVPPELPHTWQFIFRAALPPRAPSLVHR